MRGYNQGVAALAGVFATFWASQAAYAWDPLTILNNAAQGELNRQIQRGVTDVFESIERPNIVNQPIRAPIRDAGPGEVVMYGTPTCGYCKMAREYMQSRNIPYLEKDVTSDAAAKAEWHSLGGKGVPLILFGSQRMMGFSQANFDRLYTGFQAETKTKDSERLKPRYQTDEAPSGPAAAGDVLIAKIDRVKILSRPAPRSNVLSWMAKHEEAVFLGNTHAHFLKVKSASTEGWVDKALVVFPER